MKAELQSFIDNQKIFIDQNLKFGIDWDEDQWDANDWIPNRSRKSVLVFRKSTRRHSKDYNQPGVSDEYSSFMKAVLVYQFRKRKVGFIALNNFLIELKRIYNLSMDPRQESTPILLTNWHFERVLQLRKDQKYQNLYDSATNLKIIAETLDDNEISNVRIEFNHGLKQARCYNRPRSLKNSDNDNDRDDSKIPSMELFNAYAKCTNNPINDNEEILLRTIDLLISTGQRANEISAIPVDCLVKEMRQDSEGKRITDAHGSPIYTYGIKYFGEKPHQFKVHYLSDLDYQFAKTAIDRLIELTREIRAIAKFQEDNPNRLWSIDPDSIITLPEIKEYCNYKTYHGLILFLKRHNLTPIGGEFIAYKHSANKFRAGDVEKALLKKLPDHFDFKINANGKIKTVLKTSEILSIRFERAFTFKQRGTNLFKIYPHRTKLHEINKALGANKIDQSIFERRGLTEANGDRISTTSHAFRHWRNTIYHLAGMSDVQQALALGRNDLSQNEAYQHSSLKEKTETHRSFINTPKTIETVEELKKGIKSKNISGSMTKAYHEIKKNQSARDANEFLDTHANALHITPFGGCTHDFSQSPCIKHLQCWNGCSHLHVTGGKDEFNRLTDLHTTLTKALDQQLSQVGSDNIWVVELKKKIKNLKRTLSLYKKGKLSQVFPEGKPLHGINQKTSSVKDEEI